MPEATAPQHDRPRPPAQRRAAVGARGRATSAAVPTRSMRWCSVSCSRPSDLSLENGDVGRCPPPSDRRGPAPALPQHGCQGASIRAGRQEGRPELRTPSVEADLEQGHERLSPRGASSRRGASCGAAHPGAAGRRRSRRRPR
jgi:hypothetical protein